MRWPSLGLSWPRAAAARAGLGILLVEEWLSPDRPGRDPMQLVPVSGELDRPGAFRMDAFELGRAPSRLDWAVHAAAREGRFQRVRLWLSVQAHSHRHQRRGPAVDDRPPVPLAERA